MSSSTHDVTFLTNDGQTITIDWGVFRKFGIYSPQDDPATRPRDPVPLQIDATIFGKIVEYCEHHKDDRDEDDSAPQKYDSFENDSPVEQKISEWDSKFLQVDDKTLLNIITAANYLDIKPLLKLGTATVANRIKGKNPEEIRKILTAANNFTPQEEAQIARENGWHGFSLLD